MRRITASLLLLLLLPLAGCGDELPPGLEGHAVLLVAGGPGEGWSRLLRETLGGHDTMAAGDFLADPARHAAGRALIVLDREGCGAAGGELLARLARPLGSGLALLLEQPGEELAAAAGLAVASREEEGQLPWPSIPGPGWAPPHPHSPVPVAHRVVRYQPASGRQARAELLAAPAGRAVFWRRAVGQGAALVLSLPLGELAAAGPAALDCARLWWEVLLAPSHWPVALPRLQPGDVASRTALRLAPQPGGTFDLRLEGPPGESAELWLPVQRGVAALAGWEGDEVEPLGRREGIHGPERGFRLPADGGELRVGYTRF